MEQRKLALKLLKMQHKLDKFWDSLLAVGLDPSESALSEVDPLTIVGELYWLTSDEDDDTFRLEWKNLRKRPTAPEEMLNILDKRSNG
jgi:hypothetical protein